MLFPGGLNTTLQANKNMKTQTETKHTPTPWRLDSAGVNVTDSSPERYCIANVHGNSVKNLEANAAFIVRACNEHAALVAVAEAAASLVFNLENTNGWNMPFNSQTTRVPGTGGKWVESQGLASFKQALANLAAVRGDAK